MNSKRRRIQELNRLSAYLDNALSPRETRKFEARLAANPELKEKLDNLRRTKIALGHLTRLRAPHNFTLTPDMVSVRKPSRQPLQTTLRLASALAAILLVVVFSAEFFLGEIRPSLMLEAEAPVMESARVADDATLEPLIQWGAPGDQAGGMGGGGPAMGEPILEMEAMPEEAPETEELPEEQPEIPLEEAEEAPAAKGGDLILGINPDRGGEIIERSEPASAQPESEPLPWPEILRWFQIILAAIAVSGGLALFFLRVRKKA